MPLLNSNTDTYNCIAHYKIILQSKSHYHYNYYSLPTTPSRAMADCTMLDKRAMGLTITCQTVVTSGTVCLTTVDTRNRNKSSSLVQFQIQNH